MFYNYKYNFLNVIILLFQIVKAASPVLLQIIVLGAFFMYTTVRYAYQRLYKEKQCFGRFIYVAFSIKKKKL